MIQMEVER